MSEGKTMVNVFVHSSTESNLNIAAKIGLSADAQRMFAYAASEVIVQRLSSPRK